MDEENANQQRSANQQSASGKFFSDAFKDFRQVLHTPNALSDSGKSVNQILGGFLILDENAGSGSDIMVV